MGLSIDFYQLVRPHVCDTIDVIATESMWQVKTDKRYDGDLPLEFHDCWYKDSPSHTAPAATANDRKKRVDVDRHSCDHVNRYLTDQKSGSTDDDDSDDEDKDDHCIVVNCYGSRAETYIYTSPTFELGKLYEVKPIGHSYMIYSHYPRIYFPTANTSGLYTGPILKHIVERLAAAGYETLDDSVSLDATTMFAEWSTVV